MEQRLANTWRMTVNEKKFIETALFSDLRIDGRGPFDYRNVTIRFGREDGSSQVHLGQTHVMGFVTSQLVQPYRDRPNEGTLAIFTEFSPMADPSFEAGRPGESAVELGRIIDRGLRESRAVDTESLCVVAGKWVWSIRIDLYILDNGGNLVDAANIAALAALLSFRRPECTLGGEDGQEVIIHAPEVREPLPLIVHHLPIAITFAFVGNENTVVIDPSHFEEAIMGGRMTATINASGDICAVQKAGGQGVIQSVIMQCLRIASVKAVDITSKIKDAVEENNAERALRKIKRQPPSVVVDVRETTQKEALNLLEESMEEPKIIKDNSSVSQSDGMEIETQSLKLVDGSKTRESKAASFIGWPSSWDPYSKGVSADELKASLASRAAVTPPEKMDALQPAEPRISIVDPPVRYTKAAPSSEETAGAVQQTNKEKTLKDAVKPKNKRKKKTNMDTS